MQAVLSIKVNFFKSKLIGLRVENSYLHHLAYTLGFEGTLLQMHIWLSPDASAKFPSLCRIQSFRA